MLKSRRVVEELVAVKGFVWRLNTCECVTYSYTGLPFTLLIQALAAGLLLSAHRIPLPSCKRWSLFFFFFLLCSAAAASMRLWVSRLVRWKLWTRSCRRLEPRLRLKAAVYLWKRRRLEERWSYCTELQRPPFVEGFCGGKGSSRTLTTSTRSGATGNCSSGLQENGESRRNVECSCSVLHCFLYYNQRFCIRLSSFPSTLTCLPSKWDEETSQETIKVIFSMPSFLKRKKIIFAILIHS